MSWNCCNSGLQCGTPNWREWCKKNNCFCWACFSWRECRSGEPISSDDLNLMTVLAAESMARLGVVLDDSQLPEVVEEVLSEKQF